jgi:hypothetical protein
MGIADGSTMAAIISVQVPRNGASAVSTDTSLTSGSKSVYDTRPESLER